MNFVVVLIVQHASNFCIFKIAQTHVATGRTNAVAPPPPPEVSWQSPLPIPQAIMRRGSQRRGQPFNQRIGGYTRGIGFNPGFDLSFNI
jgi:hypothetical protein